MRMLQGLNKTKKEVKQNSLPLPQAKSIRVTLSFSLSTFHIREDHEGKLNAALFVQSFFLSLLTKI